MKFHFFVLATCTTRFVALAKAPKRTNARNKISKFGVPVVCSFWRLVLTSTKRTNEEMKFFFLSFWRRWYNATKRTKARNESIKIWRFCRLFVLAPCTNAIKWKNEEMKFHFFVLATCTTRQNEQTFCRLPHSTTERQHDKNTAKYQSLICRGDLFVLSTSTRRQNDRTTTRQNEVLYGSLKWPLVVVFIHNMKTWFWQFLNMTTWFWRLDTYPCNMSTSKSRHVEIFYTFSWYLWRLCYIFQRQFNIIHARLRRECSSLNADLYKINLSDTYLCICGSGVENAKHYFLECELYDNIRPSLVRTIAHNGGRCDIKTILYGNPSLNFDRNQRIFKAVHTYIKQSNRFWHGRAELELNVYKHDSPPHHALTPPATMERLCCLIMRQMHYMGWWFQYILW